MNIFIANEPEPINAVTWWRMYRPLGLLMKEAPTGWNFRWNTGYILPFDFEWADVVIAFRPSEPSNIAALKKFKEKGAKIIIDIDDDFYNIPVHHDSYLTLGVKTQNIRYAIEQLADLLWVSTEELGNLYGQNIEFWIINNAILPHEIPAEPTPFENQKCLWRGSGSHKHDVYTHFTTLEKGIKHKKIKEMIWWGWVPHYLTEMNTIPWKLLGLVDADQYIAALPTLGINYVWKPLVDIPFNRAKSNISWLEATMAGAICITNFEWPHTLRNFQQAEHRNYQEIFQASKLEIENNYNLKDENLRRVMSIRQLFGYIKL